MGEAPDGMWVGGTTEGLFGRSRINILTESVGPSISRSNNGMSVDCSSLSSEEKQLRVPNYHIDHRFLVSRHSLITVCYCYFVGFYSKNTSLNLYNGYSNTWGVQIYGYISHLEMGQCLSQPSAFGE